MRTRNEFILAKVEPLGTYGVDSLPVGANAVQLASIVNPNPAEAAKFAERTILRGTLGKGRPIFGGSLFGLQFSVELKGSGTADVPPEISPLLQACGLAETIVATTSVAYAPASTNHLSTTIYYFQEGLRYRLVGCRGTFSLNATAGEVIRLDFTMVGRKTAGDPTDTAAPTAVFDAITPTTFQANNMLSLDAFNPNFTQFTMDLQNDVITPANANAADGFGEVEVNGRDPRGSLDPDMTLVATRDWIGDFESSAESALAFQLGTLGGQRIGLSLPAVANIDPAFNEADGKRKFQYGYKAEETAGDDEFTLTFD